MRFVLIEFKIATRLPASRSSSVGPEGRFLFCHPKVKKGGGVSFDKNENHGLEMHLKSFEVFLNFYWSTRLPASRSSSVGPEGHFSFFYP